MKVLDWIAEDAQVKPKKAKDGDDDDPDTWTWERDPALTAIRREQDAADSDGVDTVAIDKAMIQVEATRHEWELQTHLLAAGGGSDTAVQKAENEMNKAQHALSVLRGREYMLASKRTALAQKARLVLADAQARSAKHFQTAAAAKLTAIHQHLLAAQKENAELDSILTASERSAPWGSDVARAHGHAFGLSAGMLFRPVMHDPNAPDGGAFGSWKVATSRLRAEDTPESRARARREEEQRLAQEETAARQKAAYEKRSGLVWSAHEKEMA